MKRQSMLAVNEIWLGAPSPAMRIGPEPDAWQVNAAARVWAGRSGPSVARVDPWGPIAAELRPALASAIAGRLPLLGLDWRRVVLDEGWLVWFRPTPRSCVANPWRSAADKLALVQDLLSFGVFERDLRTHEGRWDVQMYELFDFDPVRGPPSYDAVVARVHPDDRARFVAEHARVRREGGRHRLDFRIVRDDSRVCDMVTLIEVLHDAEGRPLTMLGINMDDSEGAGQLREKDIALRSSQARSEFLARASHELRTPLNAVIGFAQLIEHDGMRVATGLQLDRVAHIRSAGEHLLALVDDVLDLAAIEGGTLDVSIAPVEIDKVLQDVAQWSASLAQRHGVAIEVTPCGGWVQADARRLRQVVSNLVSNGIKFNRPGGTVWLGARPQNEHDAIRAAFVRRWHLCVRDDGRGVAATDREQLFEAFNRLGAEREGISGVGLGLAIVAQLAELMNGRVDVSSKPGSGSEFRVVLEHATSAAAHEAAAAASTATTAMVPPEDASRNEPTPLLTTLYIEDNAVNVILVEGLVALRPGVELRCAVDGLSGVAMAVAWRPQVVLIDMQLPDIDGFEVVRRLRAEPLLHGTRLIALSANAMTEHIDRGMAEGLDDYWTKPIDFKLFLRRLDVLIDEARAR